MKLSTVIFRALGFLTQYIAPLLLFGVVIPYVHGTLKGGLTGAGIVVLLIISFLVLKKSKAFFLDQKKSFVRGLILSIYPIVSWLIVLVCVSYVGTFVDKLLDFWRYVILFIVIGRVFYMMDEAGE